MSRKQRRQIDAFAMIPVMVLTSIACTTLPNFAVRVLLAFAAQFRGRNNGDLAVTWSIAQTFGITSKEHLVKSITMLMDRGLIVKTRQGGKKPMGPTLYALTWHPINECGGKLEVSWSMTPSHAWAEWKPPSSGLPADQTTKNQQDCRRTASGLPADQRSPESGLPPDQGTPFIGTAGSPPSRSRGRPRQLVVLDGGVQ